jgi:hypothetical protein
MIGCPDVEVLQQFREVALSPHQQEELTDHVRSCPRCRRVLDGLSASAPEANPGECAVAPETLDLPRGETPAESPPTVGLAAAPTDWPERPEEAPRCPRSPATRSSGSMAAAAWASSTRPGICRSIARWL